MRKAWCILAIVAAAVLLAALALHASGVAPRAVEAGNLLSGLAALNQPGGARLPMMRAPLSYEVGRRRYQADVYRSLDTPRMGVVLLPGAAPAGKDDPRLVEFAAWLASAGFVVLVPDIERLRRLQLRADIIDEVVDALRHMSSSPELAPQGRVGVVALSVAAGPGLLAALAPEIRDRVAFVLSIGGYHDLLATLTFSITGYFRADGQWQQREPKDLGKWIFVLSNADRVRDERDRRLLSEMARLRLAERDPSVLAPRLGPEGRDVYRFVSNRDPEKAAQLFAALPAAVRTEVEALSPSKRDLSPLRARVILVHGYDDAIIPYTESIALARALPDDRASLFLVGGLQHVDLKTGLLDAWRLWRAVYAVLRERDRALPQTESSSY